MPYKHIIFDLDHTLWDFEKNAQLVLAQLYEEYISPLGIDKQRFVSVYQANNKALWDLYHEHKITKEQLRERRFAQTLEQLGLEPSKLNFEIQSLEHQFIERSVQMDAVFPHCHRVLKTLSERVPLHIMTNGFVEAQHRKMRSSNIDSFFEHVFISEEIGANKPAARIFEHALETLNCKADECLMVGDNIVADVGGAHNVGMDQVWFNPEQLPNTSSIKPSFEIKCLSELLTTLKVN